MQTGSIHIVVGQVSHRAGEGNEEEHAVDASSHDPMEVVLVGLTQDHGNVVLSHLDGNEEDGEEHQYNHQGEDVELADQHVDVVDVVPDGGDSVGISVKVDT